MIDEIYKMVVLPMFFVIFIIDIYILVKIQKSNKNCKCAKNSYVSKILASVIIMCPLLLFLLLDNIIKYDYYPNIINLLLFIAFISLLIIGPYSSTMMFKMSKQIEKDRCGCFDSTLKNILKYYSLLRLFPIIIIMMIIIWVIFMKNHK